MADIEAFQGQSGCHTPVMLWCGSRETFLESDEVHKTLQGFEQGLKADHPAITPSMIYAYAALQSGVPFGNGAPNLSVDIPALQELAAEGVPSCGRLSNRPDPHENDHCAGLESAHARVYGWFSPRISWGIATAMCRTIRAVPHQGTTRSCRCVTSICNPTVRGSVRQPLRTQARYTLLSPAATTKEGCDNIHIFGWLDYPMQIKAQLPVPR